MRTTVFVCKDLYIQTVVGCTCGRILVATDMSSHSSAARGFVLCSLFCVVYLIDHEASDATFVRSLVRSLALALRRVLWRVLFVVVPGQILAALPDDEYDYLAWSSCCMWRLRPTVAAKKAHSFVCILLALLKMQPDLSHLTGRG